ncbi:undecaprenyl-phosphate glucose phosphotransferase [Acaryochloris sp. 'Moss Beach']|uniref:undecaprenyl-phosphate glucose phosphotransferase n=1 Tax=Acaryochloris sp. 'Moss Beach' TaxID=2740837 RepID=UPI001F458C88|nr:undecaprenyl-phosphate glucose phosphotransferase [Acaryochloris sp. 'Moss Beach']UJB68883.1 undecaprenyl-phosphate glucose phosphotransferase [Acaryochloris sp. 'Moss Beach']
MDAENLIRFSPLNVLPRNQRLLSGLVCGLDLFVILSLLWMTTFAFGPVSPDGLKALSALLMLIVPTIFQGVGRYTFQPANPPKLDYSRIWLGWGLVIAALLFLGYMSHTAYVASPGARLWFVLSPLGLSLLNPIISGPLQQRVSGDYTRTAIIAGTGDMSQRVADQLGQSPKSSIKFCGYFADRDAKFEAESCRPLIGYLDELPDFVRRSCIDVVYITLPLREEAAISNLILALQDTTACVYFVPNLMMLNLMQARVHDLNGLPMIAVMEVPFSQVQAWVKRGIDFAIATLISIAISPLMVLIAISVKLSSPGPVLFKQQRYGLNGGNIVVYKFRSMRVMEDGAKVTQATQGDPRITKVGAFLRRSSLDELPQFINVLQGRMSLVGPRPHAVAHNEHYRKLIQGYMLRHKVKPGITGWAQVNGYRGETETLDKMEKRVEFDIHYLNHWSLWLDIKIILRTALVFFNDKNAY